MVKIGITKSISRAIEKEVDGHAGKMKRASVRALNKTATKNRNDASRIVRQTINLKASCVKKLMRIQRAKSGKMFAKVQTLHQSVPLSEYNNVRQINTRARGGVVVKMRKDKPPYYKKGAFINRVAYYKKGTFGNRVRSENKMVLKRLSRPRYPINQVYGIPVSNVFSDKIQEVISLGQPLLIKNLEREINYELSKR